VKDGSIVLFHNAAINTPKALPEILKILKEKGYQIVPISEIIYRDNYTIDHKGTQVRTDDTKKVTQ
jgi:peptidoglycan/xylan/chitin deacetylase (PgdA/CDA1 family)